MQLGTEPGKSCMMTKAGNSRKDQPMKRAWFIRNITQPRANVSNFRYVLYVRWYVTYHTIMFAQIFYTTAYEWQALVFVLIAGSNQLFSRKSIQFSSHWRREFAKLESDSCRIQGRKLRSIPGFCFGLTNTLAALSTYKQLVLLVSEFGAHSEQKQQQAQYTECQALHSGAAW